MERITLNQQIQPTGSIHSPFYFAFLFRRFSFDDFVSPFLFLGHTLYPDCEVNLSDFINNDKAYFRKLIICCNTLGW